MADALEAHVALVRSGVAIHEAKTADELDHHVVSVASRFDAQDGKSKQ